YRELSFIDGLTQLYNSRHYYRTIKMEINRAIRYQQPLTILFIDVDNFKQYNDAHGHLEGDKILSHLGNTIKNHMRQADSAYRYGGEEFILVLPMTNSTNGAVVAERIRAEFKKENFSTVPGKTIHMTISVGIAQHRPGEDIKTFTNRADQLMYRAKQNGKDRSCSDAERQ
ncbi:MAG: GGDEF domain-containing protein, partial [Deltaproteobacteria bacterium]|nr:GGDEF domain-containing protein [Deltaproteobacteria bacterium]